MIPEIAAMLDQDGGTTALTRPGVIIVYSRILSAWNPVRMMPFTLDQCHNLSELRRKMEELIAFLGDCRILVTRSASGAIFFELEKVRCVIWEIAGRPDDILEKVWKKEEEQGSTPTAVSIDVPSPVEISPGQFFLSIKEIQGKRSEESSKQMLQKFIKTETFHKLEVICDHVPTWISLEAACCGYAIHAYWLGLREVKLVLTKKPALEKEGIIVPSPIL